MNPADETAVARIGGVRPRLDALLPARNAIGFQGLLHAGPPCDPGQLPPVIRNSMAAAIRFEGWESTREAALQMLEAGDVPIAPAQDHGAVVPLASVLSPSMLVQSVSDAQDAEHRSFSPINGGSGPALRLGLPGDEVVEHLRWLNGSFGDWFAGAIDRETVPLIPLADAGLAQGDDCHGRTIEATRQLSKILYEAASPTPEIRAFLDSGPSFFLNLWMAAVHCMLSSARGITGSSVITAAAGNGVEFGIQLAAAPGCWFVAPAAVPDAVYDDGWSAADGLGAIGDSAIVDMLGLGAMVVACAPAQAQALADVLPGDVERLPGRLLCGTHSGFESLSLLYGVSAARIVESNLSPVIALGVLDRTGDQGRLGGGIYRPPVELFSEALAAL